jgi:hypothetical protein
MKKYFSRLLILEFCFLLISAAYIPFGFIGEAYIQSHVVNSPCDFVGDSLGKPCVYSPLADWFDYVLHRKNHSALLRLTTSGRIEAQVIASKVAGNGAVGSTLTELFVIGFWMILLNILFIVVSTAFKHFRPLSVIAPSSERAA